MANATRTQGTILRVSSAEGSDLTITGISQATEAVVTSTAHGLATGDVVVIRSVAGMVEVNDRAFVVTNVTSNTFKLNGVNSTSYSSYGSGGAAKKQTMIDVDRVDNMALFDGTKPKIVTSHLRSTQVERDTGLPDTGESSIDLQLVVADAGQIRLKDVFDNNSVVAFTVVMRDGKAAAFMESVDSWPARAAVDEVWRGSVGLTINSARQWFA